MKKRLIAAAVGVVLGILIYQIGDHENYYTI